MDADSVSYMMYSDHLITEEDYEAITTAPNDSQMNIAILEYVRLMDLAMLYKFSDLLIRIETQQSIGNSFKIGMHIYMYVHTTLMYAFISSM